MSNPLSNIPTVPGLYVRTDGSGNLALVLVSVEQQLRDNIVRAQIIPSGFVVAKPTLPVVEVIGEANKDTFTGPYNLPDDPSADALKAARKQVPTEPGIYFMSRDLGHRWETKVVVVTVHRWLAPAVTDEVFALTLPGLEFVDLTKACPVFTLALDPTRLLKRAS